MSDEIERIAEGLREAQREWLWRLPCDAKHPYPLAFTRYGLVTSRKRYHFWGRWTAFLNDRGRAVRAHLQEQSK